MFVFSRSCLPGWTSVDGFAGFQAVTLHQTQVGVGSEVDADVRRAAIEAVKNLVQEPLTSASSQAMRR